MHAPKTPGGSPAPPKHLPPRIRKKRPLWVQVPQALAMRSALSVPLLMGLGPALHAARRFGRLAPVLMSKHFSRATTNLAEAFPDWPRERVHQYAVHSYQHLCQLGIEIAYAPRLITYESFARHLVFTDISTPVKALLSGRPVILLTGHIGNWELVGYAMSMLGFPVHAVYRPLDLAPLDQWVREVRERRGLTLISKFGAVRALPPIIEAGYPIGLVADQSGGDRGLFTPFFGRLTSSYKMIGLLAMQTGATILCGMARRLRQDEQPPLGPWTDTPSRGRQFDTNRSEPNLRYSVEVTDVFGPDDWNGQPDPLYYLTARYRRALEMMVRRAPEQYFWMHRIWRSRPAHERHGKPFPQMLKEKMLALPWMTPDEVEAIVERSRRDAAVIASSRTQTPA